MSSGEHGQPRSGGDQRQPERKPKHWLEYAIFGFVVATAFATGGAAWYTRQQWITTADSEQRQLRAYVGIVPGAVENFGEPGKQRFTLTRKNYGQTPAYDVGLSIVGFDVERPGAQINVGNIGCGSPKIRGLITMFPSMELPLYITITQNFPKTQLDLVRSGEFVFVYYGTVCYNDAFSAPHDTNYCWMYKGESMTAKDADGCTTFNDSN
jgi:hypothetical protein